MFDHNINCFEECNNHQLLQFFFFDKTIRYSDYYKTYNNIGEKNIHNNDD